MKILPFLLLASTMAIARPSDAAGPANPAFVTVIPPASDRVLRNPDCGLAFMSGLAPVSSVPAWVLDNCSIAYFRLDWASVVDASGKPDFRGLDRKVFRGYRDRGLKLSFRIMAANPHSNLREVTPRSILRLGIPTVIHTSAYGKEQADPVFWNGKFIDAYRALIRALGEYMDGQPWAGQVDLGGMGEWGEMHLSRWTEKQLRESGYTPERYLYAVTAMMDEMDRALPRTRRAFCVAPILMPEPDPLFAALVDRAVRRGWWLRSDGCSTEGPPPYVKPYIEEHWTRAGILCEPAGGVNRAYYGERIAARDYMEANLKWHPSVLDIMGMWDIEAFTPDDRKACEDAARRAGYRLRVESAKLPVRAGRRAVFSVEFGNAGVAPFFGTAVVDAGISIAGKVVATGTFLPGPPLAKLLPGGRQVQLVVLDLPAGTRAGKAVVRVRVRDLAYGPLQLGNEGAGAGEWVTLGETEVDPAAESAGPAWNLMALPLWAAEGVTVAKDAGGVLRVEGTNDGDWSYAGALAGTKVTPGAMYVMTARVRAWPLAGVPGSLYLKFGSNDSKGAWTGNFNTPKYDFAVPGTWQELKVEWRPGAADAAFMVAVEKGMTGKAGVKAEFSGWKVEVIDLP